MSDKRPTVSIHIEGTFDADEFGEAVKSYLLTPTGMVDVDVETHAELTQQLTWDLPWWLLVGSSIGGGLTVLLALFIIGTVF